MGVEECGAQLLDKTLQSPQIFLGGQEVELLLQLVDLPLQVGNLQEEVTLAARPLGVGVQGVLGQEVALLAGLTEDPRDHGAQLGGVSAALTVTVEIPLRLEPPPPLVSAQVGGVVLDGDLLPGLQGPPGLHPHLAVGLHPEHGVAHTAVVQQGERGEDGSAGESWHRSELSSWNKILSQFLNYKLPNILRLVRAD